MVTCTFILLWFLLSYREAYILAQLNGVISKPSIGYLFSLQLSLNQDIGGTQSPIQSAVYPLLHIAAYPI